MLSEGMRLPDVSPQRAPEGLRMHAIWSSAKGMGARYITILTGTHYRRAATLMEKMIF
jgi:hypothetical protein